jgi:hypothetical protein
MDYDAIAKKYGATDESAPNGQIDYNAIASKYGATDSSPNMGAFGIPEAAANIVTGMGASAVGGLAGLGTLATGGSLEDADRNLSSIQDKYTYQPRSAEGKTISHIATLPFEYATKGGQWLGEAAGKPFGLEDEGGLAGNLAAGAGLTLLGGRAALKSSPKWIPAAQSAFDMAKNEARNIRAPSAPIEYAPSKMAELARDSGNNAGRIEGAAAADRLGIGLNAGTSNPTWGNRLFSRIAGKNEVDNQLAMDSKMAWTDNSKKVAGVEDGAPLSPENIKAARNEMGKPYREVGAIRNIASGDELVKAIDSASNLEGMTPAIADYIAQAVSPLLDKLKTATAEGASGIDLINLTRKLRKDANTTYKNKNPEVGAVDLADARMAVSKALEDLAAKRLLQMEAEAPGKGYGDLAARWKEARQKIAESHVVENATDPHTYITDPVKVAKHAKKALVTGTLDDMARVASNFPEIANIAAEPSNVPFHASRYGVGGIIGGAIGGIVGGLPGVAVGTLAGGAMTTPFQLALRRYVTSKGYQGRNAFPQDFRPAPTAPVVPEPIPAPNNGLALPYYAGEPLRVFPDGSTMTGAQAEAMRLANMVQPSNPKPMEFFRSSPLPIEKQAGISEGPKRSDVGPIRVKDGGIDLANPTKVSGPSLMSLEEPVSTKKISDLVEQIPFDTKFEVANHPLIVKATHDFIDQAANLKAAIAAETNGFKRGQLEAKLRGTEREFMAGWKELGFKNEAQLRDLTQKLYQTGGDTQRGIVKTKSLKDLMQ